MREKRTFAQRTKILKSDEAKRKYFLVYEGSDTESLYFEAVDSMRMAIGIDPLIELIPIIRSYSEEGWSNPRKILDRIIDNLKEDETGYISYETLLNRIMDYLYEVKIITTSKIQARNIWKKLVEICKENLHKSLNECQRIDNILQEGHHIIEKLKEYLNLDHIIADIPNIIKSGVITYEENFDQICLIVDRDRESFTSDQYNYVLKKCREKKIKFYITNPCFEFWLLLHFDEVIALDRDKLLNNPKVTSKRRYTEQELKKIFPEYSKARYPAERFVSDIDKAIKNAKQFCEDEEELENSIGTNLGYLIEEMREVR